MPCIQGRDPAKVPRLTFGSVLSASRLWEEASGNCDPNELQDMPGSLFALVIKNKHALCVVLVVLMCCMACFFIHMDMCVWVHECARYACICRCSCVTVAVAVIVIVVVVSAVVCILVAVEPHSLLFPSFGWRAS